MGKRDKGRIPADRNAPNPGKNPRTAISDPDRSQDKPTWRVRRAVLDGPFGWNRATEAENLFVRSKLGEFETMRWFELHDKQHHYLSWDSLSKDAQDDFKRRFRDEERETIFSFRLSNKQRVIGLRLSGVFEIIWWDPEHEFCPSEKKNT